MIPFDAEFAARSAERVHRGRAGRRARGQRRCRSARTSASATRAQGDPALLRADERFETRRAPAAGGRRRGRLLQPHPRAGARRRGEPGEQPAGRRLPAARARCCTATRAGASSAFRPPTWCPRRRSSARGTASTRASRARRAAARAGGREHRRAAHLQDRPRGADRGLHARLRRRPLRQRAARWTSSRACAASGASTTPTR